MGIRQGAESRREFEEFAHTRGTALFRTALLLCGDWHLAEDLTQSALARIYASWGRVRRADSPDAYARSVLVRTYLSHRRLRRSGKRPAMGELPERQSVEETAAALALTVGAVRARSLRALNRLPTQLGEQLIDLGG
ncbi:SigE family RNA polymerase sigma factor [Kitasatospora sp. NBC_00374]